MKIRTETQSPVLQPTISEENYKRAITASGGGCLVADAIKDQYPQFTHVAVDVATIRVTDKERGERYIYLTPASVGEMLLGFDQGWREDLLPKKLLIRKAVKIIPITKSASMIKAHEEKRLARLTELEAKEKSGEPLTDGENRALGKLRNPKAATERAKSYGEAKVETVGGSVTIRAGADISALEPRSRAKYSSEQ
jgi:hypothetical protein